MKAWTGLMLALLLLALAAWLIVTALQEMGSVNAA